MPKTPPGVYRRPGQRTWSWRAQFTDDSGSRRSLSGSGCTSAAAASEARRRAVRQHEAAARRNAPAELARGSVGDYLEHWLAVHGPTVRPTTRSLYGQAVSDLLRGPVSRVPLRKLGEGHLNDLVASWESRGLAFNTYQGRFAILRRALLHAVRSGALAASPATHYRLRRRSPKTARRFWDAEDARRFLGHTALAGDPLYPLYRLALSTGLRRGELLGLHWEDIDLEAGRLLVTRQRTTAGGRVVEQAPKTRTSESLVTVDPDTLAALGSPGTGYVFVHPVTGQPWHPHTMTDRFKVACSAAGVPVIRFHELRHTAASLMAAAGVPLTQAKERLRHWSEAMTETYTHVGSESQRQVADLMGRLLSPEPPGPDNVVPIRQAG